MPSARPAIPKCRRSGEPGCSTSFGRIGSANKPRLHQSLILILLNFGSNTVIHGAKRKIDTGVASANRYRKEWRMEEAGHHCRDSISISQESLYFHLG